MPFHRALAALLAVALWIAANTAAAQSQADTIRLTVRVEGGEAAPAVATALEGLRSRGVITYVVVPSTGTPAKSLSDALGWPSDLVEKRRMARLLCDLNRHVCCADPPVVVGRSLAEAAGTKVFDCKSVSTNKAISPTLRADLINRAWEICRTEEAVSDAPTRTCEFRFTNERASDQSAVRRDCSTTQELSKSELCVPNVSVFELLKTISFPAVSKREAVDAARLLTSCERTGQRGSESLCKQYANALVVDSLNHGSVSKTIEKGQKDSAGRVDVQLPARGFVIDFLAPKIKTEKLLTPTGRNALVGEITARPTIGTNSPEPASAKFRRAEVFTVQGQGIPQAAGDTTQEEPTSVREAIRRMGWGSASAASAKAAAAGIPAIIAFEPFGMTVIPSELVGRVAQRPVPGYQRIPFQPGPAECRKIVLADEVPGLPKEERAHAAYVAATLIGKASGHKADAGVLADLPNPLAWIAFDADQGATNFSLMGESVRFLANCRSRGDAPVPIVMNFSRVYGPGEAETLLALIKDSRTYLFTAAAGNVNNIPQLGGLYATVSKEKLKRVTSEECKHYPACLSLTRKNVISVAALNARGDRVADFSLAGPAFEVAAIGNFKPMGLGSAGGVKGTSFSAPVVAGLGAMVIGKFPMTKTTNPTPLDVKNRILQTVDFSDDFNVRFGRVNFDRALLLDQDLLESVPSGKDPCSQAPSKSTFRNTLAVGSVRIKRHIDFATSFTAVTNQILEIPGDSLIRVHRSCEGSRGYHFVYLVDQHANHVFALDSDIEDSMGVRVGDARLSQVTDYTRCMKVPEQYVCGE